MITSSQKIKLRYQVGEELTVKVIEKIDDGRWIVSLDGILIQVLNQTGQALREGDLLQMQLVSLDPPQLAWRE